MLIHNYGLFWELENVFWGRQKVEGHLKGIRADSLMSDPVNFREQQGVYVLYDQSFRLVYIGQTGSGDRRLFSRLRDHTSDKLSERWSRFSWFGVRWIKNDGYLANEVEKVTSPLDDVLNHVEAILIAAAEPVHNRQGGRFGKEVHQFLQYRDEPQLGLSLQEMVRELWLNANK
jgi:hypothetical protein